MKAIDRLKQYIDYKGLRQTPFEASVGLSNGYIGKQLKREAGVGEEILVKIIDNCPDLNAEWLITGKGSMLKDDSLNQLEIYTPNLSHEEVQKLTNYRPPLSRDLIPYYGVDFTAGNAVATFDDQTVKPEYYMDIPDFRGCVAFRAYSDSMEPAIRSGSILFGTKLRDISSIEYGQVYGVILKDGRRMLKYIRKHPSKPDDYFVFSSENSAYDDMEIHKEQVKSLWLIHGHLSKRI